MTLLQYRSERPISPEKCSFHNWVSLPCNRNLARILVPVESQLWTNPDNHQCHSSATSRRRKDRLQISDEEKRQLRVVGWNPSLGESECHRCSVVGYDRRDLFALMLLSWSRWEESVRQSITINLLAHWTRWRRQRPITIRRREWS